jgi:hypothetical protein
MIAQPTTHQMTAFERALEAARKLKEEAEATRTEEIQHRRHLLAVTGELATYREIIEKIQEINESSCPEDERNKECRRILQIHYRNTHHPVFDLLVLAYLEENVKEIAKRRQFPPSEDPIEFLVKELNGDPYDEPRQIAIITDIMIMMSQ